MEHTPLVSSSLKSAGYEPETHTLEVEFVAGGVYRYYNVPLEVYKGLLNAESKGQFYVAEIRNKYNFKKI